MKNISVACRLESIYSGIRGELYQEALNMQKRGENILKLNTGNPGIFGFEMPDSIKEVITSKMLDTVSYCDFRGMKESVCAIIEYHRDNGIANLQENDIYITNGVSEGVTMLTTALINETDEILLPSPCYSLWSNSIKIAGGIPVYYNCDKDTWFPNIEDIKSKITENTKAILVINPNNPTGAVYSKKVLKEITDIAYEKNLIILSDEIYDRLIYSDAEMISVASLAHKETLCVTFNGLSKSHNICGLRCGWMTLSGDELKKSVLRAAIDKLASMRLCANSLTNLIIPVALKDNVTPKNAVSFGGKLFNRREAALDELSKCKNISYEKNNGAFYIFPSVKSNIKDDKKMCLDLLHSKKILVMPGSCFEYKEQNRIRIVMLPDEELIRKALRDIDSFLENYKQ